MDPAQILRSTADVLPGEVWLPLAADPQYAISNLGRIRGLLGQPMKQSPKTGGYLRVQIIAAGVRQQLLLHQAVLATFVGPPPANMQAAHLNGNKIDNRLSNLKWCTAAENEAHKAAHGTKTPTGEANPNARICNAAKNLISALYNDRGFTITQIADLCGLSDTTISRIAYKHKIVVLPSALLRPKPGVVKR